jgi:glycosyltransferase involved in cell wall biosynthesis
MNKISVIIPTKNEESNIARLLHSLNITRNKIEVIIADNFSTDNTVKICNSFPVKILSVGPERSRQRNIAAKKSGGDFLVFLDADMELENNTLFSSIKHSAKVDTCYFIPETSRGTKFWERCKGLAKEFNTQDQFAIRVFPRRVFAKLNGYDENLNACEDWDITDRARKLSKIDFLSAQVIHHEKISNLIKYLTKKFYYGTYLPKYFKKGNKISSRQVPFFRTSFLRVLSMFFSCPSLVVGCTLLMTLETLAGGMGFIYGLVRKT